MQNNNKEVNVYLHNRLYTYQNNFDKLKMDMLNKFRHKLVAIELPENRFVEYGYSVKAGDGSFHEAVKIVMVVAQFIGIMPVSGILNSNVKLVKFKWLSVRALLTMIIMCLGCIDLGCFIYLFFNSKSNFRGYIYFLYTSSSLFYFNIFFKLGREWPKIIRKWRRTEDRFLQLPYASYKGYTLVRKIRLVGFIMMLLTINDNVCYNFAVLRATYFENTKCSPHMNFFEYYLKKFRSHVLIIVDYNFVLFIITESLSGILVFCFNFAEIFVSLICIGFAHRFNQINQRLAEMAGKKQPLTFWMEIRTDYLILIQLLEFIDNKLSFIILIACFNDLYLISYQLFNSLNPIPDLATKIYFYSSILFFLSRCSLMLFCASSVHDSTKLPLVHLRRVPLKTWNLEVQRFYELVAYNTFGFSGKKFFYITKSMILSFVGTIATYEIFLFDNADRSVNVKNLC